MNFEQTVEKCFWTLNRWDTWDTGIVTLTIVSRCHDDTQK